MKTTRPYITEITIHSAHSTLGFVPDGNLDKRAWQAAERQRFDHDWTGRKTHPEAETQIATFWTNEHVYFAFWCKYTMLNIYEGEDPTKERYELWNRDVAEVFLNPDPARVRHYYEFEVAPNNQWIDLEIDLDKTPFHDASWNSGFEHATRVDPQSRVWTCEMRIPLRAMKVTRLEAGTEWRINFYRADGPGNDKVRRFLAWSPTKTPGPQFHVPTQFGIIRLEK